MFIKQKVIFSGLIILINKLIFFDSQLIFFDLIYPQIDRVSFTIMQDYTKIT